MLGYLMARSGVAVTVLEKHRDFFRDFRGDTVHPSTLELLYELGILDDFLKLPHQEITSASGTVGDFSFRAVDVSTLNTHCRFIGIMPQWDFLNFLAGKARRFDTFDLRMEHKAVDLLWVGGRVAGVRVETPKGSEEIRADLVIACDGRHSMTRTAAELPVAEIGVPIDVLWFRISRHPNDPENVFGRINYGHAMVLINRGNYFQTAFLIRKSSFNELQQEGLERFQNTIALIAPFLEDRVHELREWDQVKLLSVQINRLKRWHRPGLLCIGDAAHAMSPVFGVGINLAIQDAVAAANLLATALRRGRNTDDLLAAVQRRREFPVRVVQLLQRLAHLGIQQIFRTKGPLHAPWQLKAFSRLSAPRYIMARVLGMGVRPEHIAIAAPVRTGRPVLRSLLALSAAAAVGVMIYRRRNTTV
jgi:2-polyprenyl-6-methoxyphenol hydroxylase-like FAD-dependent oxidoreductase